MKHRIFKRYRKGKRGGQRYWVGRKLKKNYGSIKRITIPEIEYILSDPNYRKSQIEKAAFDIPPKSSVETTDKHLEEDTHIYDDEVTTYILENYKTPSTPHIPTSRQIQTIKISPKKFLTLTSENPEMMGGKITTGFISTSAEEASKLHSNLISSARKNVKKPRKNYAATILSRGVDNLLHGREKFVHGRVMRDIDVLREQLENTKDEKERERLRQLWWAERGERKTLKQTLKESTGKKPGDLRLLIPGKTIGKGTNRPRSFIIPGGIKGVRTALHGDPYTGNSFLKEQNPLEKQIEKGKFK